MEFKFIDHTDPFLDQVIELGKKNSQTLGLMPRDAYTQQARKKCIVVAFEANKLIGYCLFRLTLTKHRIGITQLCIDSRYRQKGVAKSLLAQVRNKYATLFNGMLVSCREDYADACELWLKFGFVKKRRVRSRSVREERYLIKFWYTFGKKDLFSNDDDSGLRVTLDLNILINLHDQRNCSDEINQLMSDWLTDEVEYCYANETLNEIHRDKDHKRTADMVKFLKNFTELSNNPVDCDQYMKLLEKLHPGSTVNHNSDRKQLAECKVSGSQYFITIDEEIISNRDNIYEALGINILRPEEFILEIDELKNRNLYEPIRLQGARFEIKQINSSELLGIADTFLKSDKGERKVFFQKRINTVIGRGKAGKIKIITSPEGEQVACYGIIESQKELVVSFIRIRKASLLNTLFYQLLVETIRYSLALHLKHVIVDEVYLTNEQRQILINNGFKNVDDHWIKVSIQDISSFDELVLRHKLSEEDSIFAMDISMIKAHQDSDMRTQLTLDLERKLWPIKFTDLNLPTYIVPIKPYWASQLFDALSSNSLLFGSQPELSWSKENVYYRNVNPDIERSHPGRILWYASDQKNFVRKKAIVGCSYLNGVSIGGAKFLFSTFRRFGIYSWREILKLSKGDINHKIKVLQFSDTEIFEKTISFSETNMILQAHGLKKQTFVSPVKINTNVFNEIYRLSKSK